MAQHVSANEPTPAAATPPAAVQQMWFELTREPASWTTLALVAASARAAPAKLGQHFAALAALENAGDVLLIDATRALGKAALEREAARRYHVMTSPYALDDAALLNTFVPAVRKEIDSERNYNRIIITLPSPVVQPAVTPLLRLADAAVVCVALGSTSFKNAKQTIDTIGKDLVLGSVTFEED